MQKIVRGVVVVVVFGLLALPVFGTGQGEKASQSPAKTYKIVFMPSVVGVPFFALESQGFKEALSQFNDQFVYVGPEKGTPEEQIALLNSLMIQGASVIDFVPTDPEAINTVSSQAMAKGIKMIENGSHVMDGNVNLSTLILNADDVGKILVQMCAKLMNSQGDFAVLSAAATSTAQNAWLDGMKKEFVKSDYKSMNWVTTVYGNDIRDKSYSEAVGLLTSYPNLKLIVAPTTVGIAAAATAVSDQKLIGKVLVTGLGLPSEMAQYVKNGACPQFAIWNPVDLGYFNAMVAHYLAAGKLTGKIGETFDAGRLGNYAITESNVVTFGKIAYFDANNIDAWKDKF